nr:hypothetical protein [Candidatus Freyarchaeota archaeon]
MLVGIFRVMGGLGIIILACFAVLGIMGLYILWKMLTEDTIGKGESSAGLDNGLSAI